jgi:uncharacterized protein (TIGR03083 family)
MDDPQIWAHIDEQRAELADFLDTLTANQWETQSLCPGWAVREVAAHVTQSATNWGRLTFELARSGFRFNAVTLRMARDDGGLRRRSPPPCGPWSVAVAGHRAPRRPTR